MEAIRTVLGHLEIGDGISFQNLTMFPLLDGRDGEPDYLTLDEALAGKTARVTEVSEGGAVPQLRFENAGDRPVLLVDGEELVGARQNRILNLTILSPAREAVVIPVSCVEAGRWAYRSREFAAAPHTHYAAGRARKMAAVSESLHSHALAFSDQAEVWDDISAKSERLAAASPTRAMHAMYDRHAAPLDAFVAALPAVEGQAGALFALGGALVGFDLFDYPATLRKLLPKLVRSYALDALDTPGAETSPPSGPDAREFLRAAAEAGAAAFPAAGMGEDVRLTGAGLTGGALLAEGRVVHLCAFRSPEAEPQPSSGHMVRSTFRARER